MNKYIHDSLKNNSRCILEGLSKPQQKALSEIIRGLFTAGEPILRHIAQDKTKSAKKQAEKYSHHLGNIQIQERKLKNSQEFGMAAKGKEPIRLIHSLKYNYSKNQIVHMYLQRWGVENIFKRVKEKFDLELIRVLKWKKFVNLVALIQLAVLVSTIMFLKIQQSTNTLIIGVLMYYKKFIKLKNLGFNVDSFITFMKNSLKPLVFRLEKPPNQLNLFSNRQLNNMTPY